MVVHFAMPNVNCKLPTSQEIDLMITVCCWPGLVAWCANTPSLLVSVATSSGLLVSVTNIGTCRTRSMFEYMYALLYIVWDL